MKVYYGKLKLSKESGHFVTFGQRRDYQYYAVFCAVLKLANIDEVEEHSIHWQLEHDWLASKQVGLIPKLRSSWQIILQELSSEQTDRIIIKQHNLGGEPWWQCCSLLGQRDSSSGQVAEGPKW